MTSFSFATNPYPSVAPQGAVIPVLSEASAHELPSHRKLTARLSPDSTTINVSHGRTPSALRITLHRTVRVPDNHATNALPPSLGRFTLHQTAGHANRLSGSTLLLRGGLFVAMHDAEAAWLQFHAAAPFALKIHVGGLNAVSGLPMVESPVTRAKRRALLAQGKPLQDYLVVPDQRWLDGIVAEDGRIRQFVAKPSGSGFSVEAQVTGEDIFGGMQIEIVPAKRNVPTRMEVRFSDRDDTVVTREVDFAARGVTAESTWLDVKKVVRDEFDVAVRDQILSDAAGLPTAFARLGFGDETRLGDLYFPPTFRTLQVQYRKPSAVRLFGATVPAAAQTPTTSSQVPKFCLLGQAPPATPSLLPKSGLFGQSTFQSSFGSANHTPPANPFGAAQESSGFVSKAAPSTCSGPGSFGTSSPFGFGNTNTNSSNTGGLFGSSSSPSTTEATPNTTTSSLFGSAQPSTPSTGSSLFGVNTSRAATDLFGNPAQQPNQTAGGLFGAPRPSVQTGTSGTGLFGIPAAQPPPPLCEMALAAGGLIKQSVAPDPHPADTWDVSASILLNIQILSPAAFRVVTGRSPHPPPTTMTGAGPSPFPFPFYALPGEQATGIKGLFGEVQSVSQLEAAAASAASLRCTAEAGVPVQVVNLPLAPFCSSFRPVEVLRKEARATGFGV